MPSLLNRIRGLFSPKKEKYHIDEILEGVKRYLARELPVTSAASQWQQAQVFPDSSEHAQFQMVGEESSLDLDPVPPYLRASLTQSEARALGILLDEKKEGTFTDQLLALIDSRGMKDSAVYRRAHLDRRLFSKIAGDRNYRPSRDTVVAFALALSCTPKEADTLLRSAGFQLSRSSRRDLVIEYFFRRRIFDLDTLNEVLDSLGEKPLGG